MASLFLETEAADVFTERFKGESPRLRLVDKSSTLLLDDFVEEEKKSKRGEDVPFVDNAEVFAPTGIFVISTLSTIGLEDERSLLEYFCPGVFLSIVKPKMNIFSKSKNISQVLALLYGVKIYQE